MTTENLLIAVVAAVIGGFVAHRMTISMLHERTKSLKKAFYNEFEIILDDFKNHITYAIDEYKNPLRDEYKSPRTIDMRLIESIMIELAGTDKIVTPAQRQFIAWLDTVFRNLKIREKEKNTYTDKWILRSEHMEIFEKNEIKGKIKFFMSGILFDIIHIIFSTQQFITEKENFTIDKDTKYIDYAKNVCLTNNIEFDESFWNSILRQATGE